MFLNVVNLLSGTVAITVESGFPERVLNLCSAHGLAFWDMGFSMLRHTVSARWRI